MTKNTRLFPGAISSQLQYLGGDIDGTEHPRRDSEEESHVRILGDERQQDDELHGVYAGLREVEGRADEPGNQNDHQQEPGELGAADLLFEAATEVPQHGDRDDHPQQIW